MTSPLSVVRGNGTAAWYTLQAWLFSTRMGLKYTTGGMYIWGMVSAKKNTRGKGEGEEGGGEGEEGGREGGRGEGGFCCCLWSELRLFGKVEGRELLNLPFG